MALTGAAARRAQNREEMRAAILAEARRIVNAGGYPSLSMRAIARGVGYSAGALYEYFPDREAILTGLYFDGAGGLGDTMTAAVDNLPSDATPQSTMAALAHAYRTYALNNEELYRLIFGALTCPPKADKADDVNSFGVLVSSVQRGVELGIFAGDPMALAMFAWATVHGFVSLELSGHLTGAGQPGVAPDSPEQGRAVRDALFDHLVQRTIRGMLAHPEREMDFP